MSIDRTTFRRGLLDIGIDPDETGVDEGELLSRVNAALSEPGLLVARKDRIRAAIRSALSELIGEQRSPVPASSAEESFESEWADGIDRESLEDHQRAIAHLSLRGVPVTAENYLESAVAMQETRR